MSPSKKVDLERDIEAGVYLSEAQNPIPSLTHRIRVYAYSNYSHKEGGRIEPKRRLERQQFPKLDQKYQHD